MRRGRKPPRERRPLRRRRVAGPKEEYQQAVDQTEVLSEKLERSLTPQVEFISEGLDSIKDDVDYLVKSFEDYGSSAWELLVEDVVVVEHLVHIASKARDLAQHAQSAKEDHQSIYDRLVDAEEVVDERWDEMKAMSPEARDYTELTE